MILDVIEITKLIQSFLKYNFQFADPGKLKIQDKHHVPSSAVISYIFKEFTEVHAKRIHVVCNALCSVMVASKNELLCVRSLLYFLPVTLNFNRLNSLCFEFGPRERQELMT